MTDADYASKLEELDRLLNDPEVPMEPARVWSLLAEISVRDNGRGMGDARTGAFGLRLVESLAGQLGGARADAGVGGVDVVEEELAGLVAGGLDALEEEADAVLAELAAVLQQERLVHALAGVVFLALLALGVGLRVEGFY